MPKKLNPMESGCQNDETFCLNYNEGEPRSLNVTKQSVLQASLDLTGDERDSTRTKGSNGRYPHKSTPDLSEMGSKCPNSASPNPLKQISKGNIGEAAEECNKIDYETKIFFYLRRRGIIEYREIRNFLEKMIIIEERLQNSKETKWVETIKNFNPKKRLIDLENTKKETLKNIS